MMTYLLNAFGFSTSCAYNGEDGLRLARSTAPHLILCDVHLPGMSGTALMQALKQDPSLKNVPVVALTGMAMAGDEAGLIALGFDGYISKPIEPEELQDQLKSYLRSASSE